MLAVRLTDAEIERVKTLAHANKTTVSGWVRWAIAVGQPTTQVVPKTLAEVVKEKTPGIVKAITDPPKSKATPQRPTENAYAAFRPVPKPGTKR